VNKNFVNQVYYKSSENMSELPDRSIDLVFTSPPYFNIKEYSEDKGQIGNEGNYKKFILDLLPIWKECYRVLKPNAKMIINTPLMPIKKEQDKSHYNRQIYNINNDIEHSILNNISDIYLLDIYIWNRTNATKSLMFGSYPYPTNFYTQNTIEFITVYVKDGEPEKIKTKTKNKSRLTSKEWTEYTKQIWNIPIPNRSDFGYNSHPAIMPEEIAKRCIKLYSFFGDVVLDPFTGSGTTIQAAIKLERQYVGYEISDTYKKVIDGKIYDATENVQSQIFKK